MEENTIRVNNTDNAVFSKGAAKALFIAASIGCLIANCHAIAAIKSPDVDDLIGFQWVGNLLESIIICVLIYGLKLKLKRDQISSPGQGLMTWLFVIGLLLIPETTFESMIDAMDGPASTISSALTLPAIPLQIVYLVLFLIVSFKLRKIEQYKSLGGWILIYVAAGFIYASIQETADSESLIGYAAIALVFLTAAYYRKFAEVLCNEGIS